MIGTAKHMTKNLTYAIQQLQNSLSVCRKKLTEKTEENSMLQNKIQELESQILAFKKPEDSLHIKMMENELREKDNYIAQLEALQITQNSQMKTQIEELQSKYEKTLQENKTQSQIQSQIENQSDKSNESPQNGQKSQIITLKEEHRNLKIENEKLRKVLHEKSERIEELEQSQSQLQEEIENQKQEIQEHISELSLIEAESALSQSFGTVVELNNCPTDLAKTLTHLSRESTRLKAEVRYQTEKNKSQLQLNQTLEIQMKNIESENTQLKMLLQKTQSSLEKRDTRLSSMKEQIRQNQKLIDQKESIINDFIHQQEHYENELDKLQNELLKAQQNEYDQNQISQNHLELSQYNKQIEELHSSIEQVKKEKNDIEVSLNEQSIKFIELQQENNSLKEQLHNKTIELEEVQNNLSNSNFMNSSLNKIYDDESAQFQNKLSDLQMKYDKNHDDLMQLISTHSETVKKLQEEEQKCSDLLSEKNQLQEKFENLQNELKMSTGLHEEEKNTLEKQIEQLKSMKTHLLETQQTSSEQDLVDKSNFLNTINQLSKENEEMKLKQAKTNSIIQEKDRELSSLSSISSELCLLFNIKTKEQLPIYAKHMISESNEYQTLNNSLHEEISKLKKMNNELSLKINQPSIDNEINSSIKVNYLSVTKENLELHNKINELKQEYQDAIDEHETTKICFNQFKSEFLSIKEVIDFENIDSLKEEISEILSHNESLKNQLSILEQQLSLSKNEVKTLQKQNSNLQSANKELANSNQESSKIYQSTKQSLTKDNSLNQLKLNKVKQENARIQAELENIKNNLDHLHEIITFTSIDDLYSSIRQMILNKDKEIQELHHQFDQSQFSHQLIESQSTYSDQQYQNQMEIVKKLKDEKIDFQSQISKMELDKSNLEHQIRTMTTENNTLNKILSQIFNALQTRDEKSTLSMITQLKSSLSKSKRQIRDLNTKLRESEQKIQDLRFEIEKQGEKISQNNIQHTADISDYIIDQTELLTTMSVHSFSEIPQKFNLLTQELTDANNTIDTLEAKLKLISQKNSDQEEHIKILQTQNEAFEASKNQIIGQLQKSQKAALVAKRANKKLTNQQNETKAILENYNTIVEKNKELQNRLSLQESEIEQKRQEYDLLQEKFAKIKSKYEETNNQNSSLSHQIKNTLQRNQILNKQNAELFKTNNVVLSENHENSSKITELRKEIELLTNQKQEYNKVLNDLKIEVETLKNDKVLLTAKVDALNFQNSNMNLQNTDLLKDENLALRDEHQQMSGELEQTKNELTILRVQNEKLSSEIIELMTSKNEQETKIRELESNSKIMISKKDELTKEIQHANQTILLLEKENNTLKQKTIQLSIENQNINGQTEANTKETQQLKEINVSLSERANDLSQKNKDLIQTQRSINTQLTTLNLQNKRLNQEIQLLNHQKKELENQNKDAESEKIALESLVNQLHEQKEKLSDEILSLKAQVKFYQTNDHEEEESDNRE